MYHRMYIRRCSMSSISEESETGDDEHLDEEFIVCNDQKDHQNNEGKNSSLTNLSMNNCLGDLNTFKEDIREAYEDLSTLERQARNKTSPDIFNIEQGMIKREENLHSSPTAGLIESEDDLDILLEQLHSLEQRLDQTKMFRHEPFHRNKKSISPSIVAQFDELDQALATLTSTLNNVQIELVDSGNSSSSSAVSEATTIPHRPRLEDMDDKHQENEVDEHFSDSGLSQSTDSISLPYKQLSQIRTSSQISNASSVLSCNTLKNSSGEDQIRLALEKMYEANIKKMFVKIHNTDQSTKNLLIDETMSISDMIILLLHKYHLQPTLNYCIVEDLPDLHIYRILEDHENLIHDAMTYWSRDTSNRICFRQHSTKYSMFTEAKKFFSTKEKLTDEILTDYISSNAIILPDDITSILHIKDKNRKIWKKYSCILRQSGIYQMPKPSSSKRDLVCLIKFDSNMHLYYANNWTESLRSPSEHGFTLKYAHIQKKSNKYIHYLCANTFDECQRWINGIRIIQYGIQLYDNYQQMRQVVDRGEENLAKILPNQHQFNFIQSNTSLTMSESFSTISLPINQIISDARKLFMEQDVESTKKNFNSLDRLATSKANFTRSSSFHDSLRRSNKNTRTCSTSPIKTNDLNLKRSKSTKEITSKFQPTQQNKSSHKSMSTSSFIPLINQCIHPEKTPTRSKPPLSPPKRPPPPPPKKQSSLQTIDNHIYDSFHDNSSLTNQSHRSFATTKTSTDAIRTVPKPHLPPMRVTEL